MRTKILNLFSLLFNAVAVVGSIVAIVLMIVFKQGQAFGVFSMYATILILVTCAIGMYFDVRTFKKAEHHEAKWYLVLRMATVTTAVLNSIMAFALIHEEVGALETAYILPRLVLPILLIISYVFFEIGDKKPFEGVAVAPIYVTLFLIIAFIVYGCNPELAPYEYLNAGVNPWFTSFMTIFACATGAVLVAAVLLAGNSFMRYALVGKKEKEELEEKARLEKEAEEVAELEEAIEEKHEEAQLEAEEVVEETVVEEPVEEVVVEEVKEEPVVEVEAPVQEPEEEIEEEEAEEPVIEESVVVAAPVEEVKKEAKKPAAKKKAAAGAAASKKAKKPAEKKKATAKKGRKKKPGPRKKPGPKPKDKPKRIYHVARHKKQNKWQVKAANAKRALRLFDTQLDAINYAKDVVRRKGGSVRIHSMKGQIRKG